MTNHKMTKATLITQNAPHDPAIMMLQQLLLHPPQNLLVNAINTSICSATTPSEVSSCIINDNIIHHAHLL
jgi:hypothetical protein